jgi:hypothetical protein
MIPVLMNLTDKNSLVRNINLDTMKAWKENAGAHEIISISGKVLKNDNPDLRQVLLDWILENKDSIPKSDCE